MKIFSRDLTESISPHSFTLMVINHPVTMGGGTIRNVPNDWFMRLTQKDGDHWVILPLDSPKGYLYYTYKGYQANKTAIRKMFESRLDLIAPTKIPNWTEFEKQTDAFFKKVANDMETYIEHLRDMTAEAFLRLVNTSLRP